MALVGPVSEGDWFDGGWVRDDIKYEIHTKAGSCVAPGSKGTTGAPFYPGTYMVDSASQARPHRARIRRVHCAGSVSDLVLSSLPPLPVSVRWFNPERMQVTASWANGKTSTGTLVRVLHGVLKQCLPIPGPYLIVLGQLLFGDCDEH